MRLKNGAIYRFVNDYHDGYGLNIYGTGAGSIKGGQNVCLYPASAADEMQQWKAVDAEEDADTFRLSAVLKSNYVLDCSDGSIATSYKNNAHMCEEKGTSDADCALVVEPVGNNRVMIRLSQKDLYLTATTVAENAAELSNNISTSAALRGGSTGRGNVYWKAAASEGSMTWKKQCWEVIEVSGGSEPEPGEYDKNYLIYPTTVMNLTQNYNGSYNHYLYSSGTPHDYPIDEACEDEYRSWFYCPCDEMVVAHVYTQGTNTVWLESTSPVVTPSGTYDKISIMVMHPEDEDLLGLKGKTFTRGQTMFREGKDGNATGNHFHMSVGTGSYNGSISGTGWTQNTNGAWVLTPTGNTLKPEDAFYVDTSVTKIINNAGLDFVTLSE